MKWFSNSRIEVVFIGSCLKQGKTTLRHGNVVHLLIAYEVNTKFVCNCLFGSVNSIKNADPDKYVRHGYDMDFIHIPNIRYPMVNWVKMLFFV